MNKDQLSKVIESTVVSISASIPIAASFATGWTEYRNHMQEKNVIEIIRTFLDRVKILEEKVDKEYLKSTDFKSLTMKVCLHGMDEVQEEKRKYLSNFLANSCILENSKNLIKNSVLETLMKLSQFDLVVLKILFRGVRGEYGEMIRGNGKFVLESFPFHAFDESYLVEQLPNFNELEVRVTLHYLESLGVIENLVTRSWNRNLSSDIDEHLLDRRISEIRKRIEELNKNWSVESSKDLKDLNKELEEFNNRNEERNKRNSEKTFVISSLGVKVLDYILN